MEIYSIELAKDPNFFKKVIFALKKITNEYQRKILLGFNIVNFSDENVELIKKDLENSGCKVFLSRDFPYCVFSYVCKYKMCDMSIVIKEGKNFELLIFSGSGYPICSYQKKLFLKNFEHNNFSNQNGEIFNLKLENSLKQYIKHVFGKKADEVTYIKNCYELYYFKVHDNYYVLNKNFTIIANKDKMFVKQKLEKYCKHRYNVCLDDNEFDVFLYMLSRNIKCISLVDDSIIFDDSYYMDCLKVIYYLEFM